MRVAGDSGAASRIRPRVLQSGPDRHQVLRRPRQARDAGHSLTECGEKRHQRAKTQPLVGQAEIDNCRKDKRLRQRREGIVENLAEQSDALGAVRADGLRGLIDRPTSENTLLSRREAKLGHSAGHLIQHMREKAAQPDSVAFVR